MGFLDKLLQMLLDIVPWRVVYSYEQGVRWTFGRTPTALQPGVHLCLPIIHEVQIISVVDEFFELPVQSVITKDGELVCFSVSIGYRVTDPVAHFCSVTNFQDASEGIAMTHLAQRVRDQSYQEVTQDLKTLENSLKGTLTTRMKDWGTEVFLVGFNNFAHVPYQFRMFGGGLFGQ